MSPMGTALTFLHAYARPVLAELTPTDAYAENGGQVES